MQPDQIVMGKMPELRRLLEGVLVAMKLSNDWVDFQQKLDLLYPKFGTTMQLPFEEPKKLAPPEELPPMRRI